MDQNPKPGDKNFEKKFCFASKVYQHQKCRIIANNLLQIFGGWGFLPVPYLLRKYIEWLANPDAPDSNGRLWGGLIIFFSLITPLLEILSDHFVRPCRIQNTIAMMVN
jgi:hypothetical protein